MEITTLYPEFFDDTALRLPPIQLHRLDDGGTRIYYTYDFGELKLFPGVTGLLDAVLPTPQWLIEWKAKKGIEQADAYKNERAVYGTLMHKAMAKLLRDGAFKLDALEEWIFAESPNPGYEALYPRWEYELSKDLLAFAEWAQSVSFVPLGIEVPLCTQESKELNFASCVDIWGKADITVDRKKISGAMVIIDLKSGKNSSTGNAHRALQLSCYEALIKLNYPEFEQVEFYLYNWSPKEWTKSPTCHFNNQTGKHSRRKIELLNELYHMDHDLWKKTRLAMEGEVSLSTPTSNNYTVQTYAESCVPKGGAA